MVISNSVIQPLKEDFAPYAAVSNVMEVITRKRDHGLPAPLNPAVLETISIPKGNTSRTLQALNFLGLIDGDGTQTELFNRLGRAGEANNEYRAILEDIIRSSYERVFTIVDPAQNGETAIHDAFRQFEPEAQRGRMVAFFLGMCEQAGIVQSNPRQRKANSNQTGHPPIRRTRTRPTATAARQPSDDAPDPLPRRSSDEDAEYRLVFAVMQQLPSDRQWSANRRKKWLAAVEAAVDLMVDVIEEPHPLPVLMAPGDSAE